MINLLPTNYKNDVKYARLNTKLRNWIAAFVFALAGTGLILAGGLIYMNKTSTDYSKRVAVAREQLQVQKVDETQKRIDEISNNTKLTLQVLSREILFSKLIRQLGSALPANTALSTLQIDEVKGGVQLDAYASDFNAGTQLQINLQDPQNGVFEKADINSITCGSQAAERVRLPCDVSIRALFGKNNPYVYITTPATTGGASR